MKVISWFSAGAASAIATKCALDDYRGNVEIIYQQTNAEHPDNERFLDDCAKWFNKPIQRMQSEKYHDIWEVFNTTKYLVGAQGAPCTSALKRIPAEAYITHGIDHEIFGYTAEETHRVTRFKENNPERLIITPLISRNLTKEDCLGMLAKANIELPAMYKLGYTNNNCIGCVKGGMGYWNKIRIDFPKVFNRMAKLERELNVAICKNQAADSKGRIFLDELDPKAGFNLTEPTISCGIMCEIESERIQENDNRRAKYKR